jgi:hypothetical protein
LYNRIKHITFTNSAKSCDLGTLKSNQQLLVVVSNPKAHLLYHFEKKTVGILLSTDGLAILFLLGYLLLVFGGCNVKAQGRVQQPLQREEESDRQ